MRRSDFIVCYRIRNWPVYNRALVRRGSLTFRVDEEAVLTIAPQRNAPLSTAKGPPDFRVERDPMVRRSKEERRYPWRNACLI